MGDTTAGSISGIFLAVIIGILELFLIGVLFSIGPVRVLLSKSYREKTQKRYKDKPVEAAIEIVVSLIALILALGGAIFLLFIALTPEQPPSKMEKAKEHLKHIFKREE